MASRSKKPTKKTAKKIDKTAVKTPATAVTKPAAKTVQKPVPNKSAPDSGEGQLDITRIGRPHKLVESDALIKQLLGLGRIQCKLYEAAAALFVSENTLRDFLRDNPRSAAAWEMAPEFGKASLRRMQWNAAAGGNARMQIWLGKQLLDQRDKFDGRLTGAGGGPIKHITAEMTATEAAAAWADTMNDGP